MSDDAGRAVASITRAIEARELLKRAEAAFSGDPMRGEVARLLRSELEEAITGADNDVREALAVLDVTAAAVETKRAAEFAKQKASGA